MFASVILILGFSVVEAQGQYVTVSGSGSGALQTPPVGIGGLAWASCTIDRSLEQISCQTNVFNIVNLSAGHLHIGGPGASGPVVIPIPDLPIGISGAFGQDFTLEGANFIPRAAAGVRNFDELAHACASGNCYLNYHTPDNPPGAIRVQLCPASRQANVFNGVAVCTGS